jgi:hypothetical protein
MAFIKLIKFPSEYDFKTIPLNPNARFRVVVHKIRVKYEFLTRYNLDFGNLSFIDLYGTNGTIKDFIAFMQDWIDSNDTLKDIDLIKKIINELEIYNPELLIDFEEEIR